MCTGDVRLSAKAARVVSTRADYLAEFDGSTQGRGAPPEMDFTANVVVVARMGEQPNCGSTIAVTDARETETEVHITVTHTVRRGCPADDALSYPAAFVSLPRRDKPYTFIERTVSMACQGS